MLCKVVLPLLTNAAAKRCVAPFLEEFVVIESIEENAKEEEEVSKDQI
jgi:hypothetical protein